MKRTATALIVAILGLSLGGCARTTTDTFGEEHPNGVAYYDREGQLHQAEPEAISPKAQDAWETAGWVALGAAAVGGLTTGIVGLTH